MSERITGGGTRRSQVPQGQLVNAFTTQYGAMPGSVKMTYAGKDKYGAVIYKFNYRVATMRSPSGMIATRTLAVNRDEGVFGFSPPNSAAGHAPITGVNDATLRAPDQSLIDRAVIKINDLVERGLMSVEEGKLLIGQLPSMSNAAITTIISRGSSYANAPSVIEVEPDGSAQGALDDIFTGIDYGGGGGGGGGALEPIYRAPDKRVVEDIVKGSLISLVGVIPEHLLGPAVEVYMADDFRNWSSETEEINPQQSVLAFIRNTHEYQTVHKLRPKQLDEREWIAQRRQQGERGGLQTDLDQFAINQATVGGDLGDVERAAATQQFQKSGKMPSILDNQFRDIAAAMMARVAR